MQREIHKLLFDILQACELLEEFSSGKTLADFEESSLFRSGVERQFITIGEALSRLSRIDSKLLEMIPSARRIIGFRNILTHGYDVIDNQVVWDALQHRTPELVQAVKALLDE